MNKFSFFVGASFSLLRSGAILGLLFLVSWSGVSGKEDCTYVINPTPESPLIIEPGMFDSIAPGETICLRGGEYLQVLVRNLHGKAEAPIVIRNKGEEVVVSNTRSFGFAFHNSTHVALLGNGVEGIDHGVVVAGTSGNGVSIDQKSSNVEVGHVAIANTGMSGIMAKTDPRCDDLSAVRDSFALYETVIHNNYLYNTTNEAIYLGSSYYTGFTLHCDGQDTLVYPHELIGVRVHDNIIRKTGKNAIQVSSATQGCLVFNNTVSYDSQDGVLFHMNGIQIGGGSRCDVFNNTIADGRGSGINYFGQGPALVFNNLIVNPGRTHHPGLPPNHHPVHGIYVRSVVNETPEPIHLFHNTIVNPKTDGVVFLSQDAETNRLQNNIIINPGSYPYIGKKAFVNVAPDVPAVVSNNYLHPHAGEIKFTDTIGGLYCLRSDSPAINAGVDLFDYGITFDLNGSPRPYGPASDLGAYEYQFDTSVGIDSTEIQFSLYPNPARDYVHILFNCPANETFRVTLFGLGGEKVWESTVAVTDENVVRLPLHALGSGKYVVDVRTSVGRGVRVLLKH